MTGLLRAAAGRMAAGLLAAGLMAPTSHPDPAWAAEAGPAPRPAWLDTLGPGGHIRFDYYSASKRLDNNHSLPGLTLQPKALPKFGAWGDGKVEGRIHNEDLGDRQAFQGRLLEAYANLYFRSVDVRLGKQIITWGRADALNPTDNLTPKDFTLLSAKDEEERRIGATALKVNYYRDLFTLSFIWLPLFNPSTISLAARPGFLLRQEKRDEGHPSDHGLAAKVDRTGGDMDWSVSYYYGRDVLPTGLSVSPSETILQHNRLHVFGADFARPLGRYGIRGEAAYAITQDQRGADPFIKNPSFFYVLGADRDLTEDLNVNVQFYQRVIVNFEDPYTVQDPDARDVAVLNAIFNQQQDRIQEGLTGRIKATWWNKTLEGELLGVWNANRGDFFLRPSLAYAFTDIWKGFAGADIFNGRKDSFFGRLQNTTALFVEVRATL